MLMMPFICSALLHWQKKELDRAQVALDEARAAGK
jgi:hypothetical protein